MSYVAFDEERIVLLRSRMGAALDDLRRIGCSDPEAFAALTTVRTAIADLEQLWLPAVIRVDNSDVLTRFDSTRLSTSDLATAFMSELGAGHGWSVIDIGDTTWLGDPSARITVEEAIADAEALNHGDVDQLTDDPAERELLAAVLAAASNHPAVAAAFFDTFTKMNELADSLAARRVQLAFDRPRLDPDGTVEQVDAIYRGLAEAYTAANGPNSFPPIDGMDPYSAAQLMRWAHLDGAHAAITGDAILVCDTDGETSLNRLVDKVPGDNTTDVVMGVLAATPGAATPYVLLAKDRPETMWWGAADMAIVHTVAMQGLDPGMIDPRDAGAVLHAFISWFRDEMYPVSSFPGRANPYESRSFLGELAAPYLILYSPLDTTWGTTPDAIAEHKADLDHLVSDEGAMRFLLDGQDYLVTAIDFDGSDIDESVRTLAALIGFVGQIVANRRVEVAQDAVDNWEFGWKAIGRIVGLVPGGGAAGKQLIDAVKKSAKQLPKVLNAAGLAPPTADSARSQQVAWQRQVTVATSVALTQAYWEQLVASGRVSGDHVDDPPSYDPSWEDPYESYYPAFDAWRDSLPDGAASMRDLDLLTLIRDDFVNVTMFAQAAGGG